MKESHYDSSFLEMSLFKTGSGKWCHDWQYTSTIPTSSIRMHNISAEMNESGKKEKYLNFDVLSDNLKEQQESPQSNASSYKCDDGCVNSTKERDVTRQDRSDNSGSKNCLGEKPKRSQDGSNSNCESPIPCHNRQETSEATASVEEAMRQENVLKPLDLRLQKKSKDKQKCNRLLEPGSSVSLIMEVDEIDDDALYIETAENEDDQTDSFHLDDWDQHPSVALSPTCGSIMSHDVTDTLLIDVKGIPYTLTPDGRKVPQIHTSKVRNFHRELIVSLQGSSEVDSTSLADEDADSDQELFLPNVPSGSSPEEKKSAEDPPGQATLPSLSSISSFPVQIGASNTDSSTPLLHPPSQLQALKSSNPNPGVLTMSLSLNPSPSIEPVPAFLVLSSQTHSTPQSSLVPQMHAVSPVALSPSSGLPDLKSELISYTTATDFSGQNNPCTFASSPTSPTSSGTFSNLANQLKTEPFSDAPTSFREALLRLAVSAEQKNVNQPKCIDDSLGFNHCTDVSRRAEGEHHNADGSPIFEQAFISVDGTDSSLQPIMTTDHSLQSSTSPLYHDSDLLPEDPDSQLLGPRRILYCQYCPRIFYFLSDLERHSITHSQKKPHVCQWCDKAFKRSSHLERHKHIHTGERNFECQLCPRRFREAAELSRHQRVHTGEKPYQCLLCHMRFSERNTLRRHTKRKHQGQHHETMHRRRKTKTAEMPEQEEENAEWYSSAVAEMESDNDTGGE